MGERTILVVENDETCGRELQEAWRRLRLDDKLRIVKSRQEALEVLRDSVERGSNPVAAVVLDPDATGEETGRFLREIRAVASGEHCPVTLWAREGLGYEALDGASVDSVEHKPMILRLIQTLDGLCDLRSRKFAPYAGGVNKPVFEA